MSDTARENPSARDVADDLRMAVFRLARRVRSERIVDELTDSQFAVITFLCLYGPHRPGALAARERVSAPAMSRTLRLLERGGYVRRAPDPGDGRQLIVELTETGERVVAETVRKRNAWLEQALSAYDDETLGVMRRAAGIMQALVER